MSARERLPNRRPSVKLRFEYGSGKPLQYEGTYGLYPDGRVGEVFLEAGKAGTDVESFTHDAAIAVSIGLQYGVPLEVFREAFLRNEDGSPASALSTFTDLVASDLAQ